MARMKNGRERGSVRIAAAPFAHGDRFRPGRSTIAGAVAAILSPSLLAAELPVPCISGVCGNVASAQSWVGSGTASAVTQGNVMTIQQGSNRVLLNWRSFNLGADASVEFKQPSAAAVAINRIFQSDPSRILGKLTANGQVYLINTNGLLFGKTAQVNVGGLVASTLDIADEAVEKGLVRVLTEDRKAAFAANLDAQGRPTNGDLVVEKGATMTTIDGGQIMLFAPNVTQSGDLSTPNGQTIMAAGSKIYLALDSRNTELRGLVVEVDVDGVSDQELEDFIAGRRTELSLGRVGNFGNISANSGNATLAGLAVNQAGRISASTSVRANGTIYLKATDKVDAASLASGVLRSTRGGRLDLQGGSITQANPDLADTSKTVDVNDQPESRILLSGREVRLRSGSTIQSRGGTVDLVAQEDPSASEAELIAAYSKRGNAIIESGATVDVSGSVVSLDADRLTTTVQLFSEQLKNSPEQRDGVLRGKEIVVDLRQHGVREDGSTWVGTPLADVSGAVDTIERTVAERTLEGGTINLRAQGRVDIENGATLDVSGGRVDYREGMVNTTKLLSKGVVYDISAADPSRTYDAILGTLTIKSQKWGVTDSWTAPETWTYSPAYSEGRDAGTLSINATGLRLDGQVNGSAFRGDTQRLAAFAPLGGQFVLGFVSGAALAPPDYRTRSITFGEGTSLEEDPDDVFLRSSLFGRLGLSRLRLFANDRIQLPEDVRLDLGAGGSLELRANAIDIQGDVIAPGGVISAVAVRTVASQGVSSGHVQVGSTSTLDVSGLWTNDLLTASGATRPSDAVQPDGGSITLQSANGDVIVGEGALLDASGSAWVARGGRITAGKGGSITLAALDDQRRSSVQLSGTITASGLQQGGRYSLTTDAVCIATVDCGERFDDDVELTLLHPEFFADSGFGSFSITSKRGDLVVAAGTLLAPRQRNRVLGESYLFAPSGADVESLSSFQLLPDDRRSAANLTLGSTSLEGARLEVQEGARILVDPLGSIALNSRTQMLVDGALVAHGGNIALTLSQGSSTSSFAPDAAIWLGAAAVLDASGQVMLKPDVLDRPVGSVLDGGTVSLSARRGFMLAEQGSLIDVSGTADTLYVRGEDDRLAPTKVASDAGSVTVSAAEAAVLGGTLRGQAGDATTLGGTFSLVIDPNTRGEPPLEQLPDVSNRFPHDVHAIEIVAAPVVDALQGLGLDELDDAFVYRVHSISRVHGKSLTDAGFDSLSLTSRNLLSNDSFASQDHLVRAPGTIRFNGDLIAGRRVTLDAPVLEIDAGAATLAAPYVAFGSRDPVTQSVPVPVGGGRSLTVDGGWIDIIGSSVISGAESVTLHSDADIRLRPLPALQVESRALAGSLTSVGKLTLAADQIYPASMTAFDIRVLDGAEPGTIAVKPGGDRVAPLSAGGTLQLRASRIEQGGVLVAPLGTIRLESGTGADSWLRLEPGSVTSTTAAGSLIPLGRTEGGEDWVYDLGNTQKLVFGDGLDALPQQAIELEGATLELSAGATLDVRGGGDLQAYEFVPGVGGTVDVLANDAARRSYAILPAYKDTVGPYDPQDSAGFGLAEGTTLHLLSAVGALAAGEYVLLPARYALLPGAWLVTEQAGLADLPAGTQTSLLDGTTVVAGRYGVAGTDQQDSRTRGFSIRSSEFLRDATRTDRPAEYSLQLASAFFAPEQLVDRSLRLPGDAGVVTMSASETLELQATLRGAGANAGRGAALDIAAPDIVITAGSVPDGEAEEEERTVLSARTLDDLEAESLLIGGVRSKEADGVALNVSSRNIVVESGVNLAGLELLLAANQALEIGAGARIEGRGALPASAEAPTYLVGADAALLRVSAAEQAGLVHAAGTGTVGADLRVATGATIAAAGSALLDASGEFEFAGEFALSGADLRLGASAIRLGAVPSGVTGLVLDQADLTHLSQDVGRFALRTDGVVDLYGGVQVGARAALEIDASALRLNATKGETARLAATDVRIRNSGTAPAPAPGAAGGTLEFQAETLHLAQGDFTITGADAVSLAATRQIRAEDEGSLHVAAPLLSLATPALTGDSGATRSIVTDGRFALTGGSAAAMATAGAGAAFSIQGEQVEVASRIAAPAGRIFLTATGPGGVRLGNGAALDVSGVAGVFDSQYAIADAGEIRLDARQGDVSVASGATLRADGVDLPAAAQGGNAGRITLSAPGGTVSSAGVLAAHAGEGARGGSATIDANRIEDADGLNATLNDGGFDQERSLRLRSGSATLNGDIRAHRIAIRLDGADGSGALRVDGSLLAGGEAGGSIDIATHGQLDIGGTALLDVSASAADARGGSVTLSSAVDGVRLEAGSVVNAAGGPDGRGGAVSIEVDRSQLAAVSPGSTGSMLLAGSINGAERVDLVGRRTYQPPNGIIGSTDIEAFSSAAWLDAEAFALTMPAIATAFGRDADTAFHVHAGIEFSAPGDLTLAADWDLSSWRFGGEVGVLTLRSGRDLLVNGNLGDGFSPDYSTFQEEPAGDSWSLRLAADRDILLSAGTRFAPRFVRTGNGDIDVAAGRDLVLADNSAIYTMGKPVDDISPQLIDFLLYEALGGLSLSEDGGDIRISAGRDVLSQPATQLVTDWMWRLGSPANDPYPTPTLWGPRYESFRSGVGALAGGNVSVAAGGNVDNLSAAVSTVGVPTGETQFDNVPETRGGGTLDVRAGGDIRGGVYYVGRGEGRLSAGEGITAGTNWTGEGHALHTVLALGDASFSLNARRDLTLETIFDPMLFSPGRSQQSSVATTTWLTDHVTYGASSGVSALSASGDTRLNLDVTALLDAVNGSYMIDSQRDPADTLLILPPQLRLAALNGDVLVGRSAQAQGQTARLVPSSQSLIQLLAEGDVRLLQTGLLLSDADPALLPTARHPTRPSRDFNTPSVASILQPNGPFAHAAVPVHAGDDRTSLIVASTGDIDMSSWQSSIAPAIQSAMPLKLVAGRDVIDASFNAQNVDIDDITSVTAGRDVTYSLSRDANRRIVARSAAMTIDGPGDFVVMAGRNVDLKASPGISTRGDTLNGVLPDEGAAITLLAGIADSMDQEGFIQKFFRDRDTYRDLLDDWFSDRAGPADLQGQLAALAAMTPAERAPLLAKVLFAELRTEGRRTVKEGTGDFGKGYAAIRALFPGIDPGKKPTGDLQLYFSRIYTLDGGDLNALAPGGMINVGLSSPPATFGISKSPSQLGIVAQRTGDVNLLSGLDTLVNQSRVFAADGGSILIWSSAGNIDAGRGAKTAISAPPPVITYDSNGNPTVEFPPALTGSGIRAFVTTAGRKPGDVDLFAPTGVILVNDAGIGTAGNLTIGATQVIGADNIDVGGVAIGVPVDTSGLGASLSAVSATSSGASSAAESSAGGERQTERAPIADTAMSWLEVFVVGLGEDACRPDDAECLRKQKGSSE